MHPTAHPDDAETHLDVADELGPPVDQPDRAVTWAEIASRESERRPIVPAWMRSRVQRRQVGHWVLGHTAHKVLYHATRSPKYLFKVLFWAPVGVFKTVTKTVWWARAEEGNWSLRQHAASKNDAKTWESLERIRQASSAARWWVFGGCAFILAVAVGLLLALGSRAVDLLAAAAAVVGFAVLGRPADKPITDRVVYSKAFYKLTAENTRRALVSCGAGIKEPGDVSFPRDIFKDPPGQTAIVELPTHVLATDVIDRREYLAAGFRLPLAQVWPDTVPGEHPGVLQIWISRKPVNEMTPPPLPLDGPLDYFGQLPWGYDVRLRPQYWTLDERNSLFAGAPGSGKSLAMRNVALAAALDPLVVLLVSELKGSGDYDMFGPLCPEGMYISGADEQSKQRTLDLLEWLYRECEVRGPLINGWVSRGYNDDNKVNRRMAEADDRLRPLVVVLDEIQELITDPEMGKRAIFLITSIVKRGRALGIHLLLGTQRIDKQSVPRGISSNVVNRMCLAVQSHTETDLVLGTGAYARGARPTVFMPPPDGPNPWAGFGCLAGKREPVRGGYLDNKAARAIAKRALRLREGMDLPKPEKVRSYNLAEDCLMVWPPDVATLWLADLLGLLQGLRPDVYGELDAEALSAALRASKIKPVPVHKKIEGAGYTRAGVRIEHLQAAIEAARLSAIDAISAGQT